jgi:hypothetical protein
VARPSHFKIPAHLGPTLRGKQRVTPQATEVLTAAMKCDNHGGIGDRDAPVQPNDGGRTSFEVQRKRQKRVILSSRGEFRLAPFAAIPQCPGDRQLMKQRTVVYPMVRGAFLTFSCLRELPSQNGGSNMTVWDIKIGY